MGSSSIELNGNHGNINDGNHVHLVDIFPLSNYYFGSKDPVLPNDETLALRTERMKSNYAAYGIRTRVEAVILVELFKHPHLLLLQIRNSVFSLPGGRLRPGESDVGGLKRKLSSKLKVDGDPLWEVVECLGMWWRPDFESLSYPYLPPNVKWPKECTKLFLVKLPSHRKFVVPKNQKLIAVPLCQLHENSKLFYDNGAISIILEYMDGGFLEDLLSKVRAIPEPYLAPICKQKDPKDRHRVRKLMVHPFITMYDDLEIDLASYFSTNGSPLANL